MTDFTGNTSRYGPQDFLCKRKNNHHSDNMESNPLSQTWKGNLCLAKTELLRYHKPNMSWGILEKCKTKTWSQQTLLTRNGNKVHVIIGLLIFSSRHYESYVWWTGMCPCVMHMGLVVFGVGWLSLLFETPTVFPTTYSSIPLWLIPV
jgi:hypothetical protein